MRNTHPVGPIRGTQSPFLGSGTAFRLPRAISSHGAITFDGRCRYVSCLGDDRLASGGSYPLIRSHHCQSWGTGNLPLRGIQPLKTPFAATKSHPRADHCCPNHRLSHRLGPHGHLDRGIFQSPPKHPRTLKRLPTNDCNVYIPPNGDGGKISIWSRMIAAQTRSLHISPE